jgi:hypothetical protein
MDVELPWSWRNNRRRVCAVPWGDTFKYREQIQILTKVSSHAFPFINEQLIRSSKANKSCPMRTLILILEPVRTVGKFIIREDRCCEKNHIQTRLLLQMQC